MTETTHRRLMRGIIIATTAVSMLATGAVLASGFWTPAFAEESTGTTSTTVWTNLDRDGGWVYIKDSSYFVNARERDLRKVKKARRNE